MAVGSLLGYCAGVFFSLCDLTLLGCRTCVFAHISYFYMHQELALALAPGGRRGCSGRWCTGRSVSKKETKPIREEGNYGETPKQKIRAGIVGVAVRVQSNQRTQRRDDRQRSWRWGWVGIGVGASASRSGSNPTREGRVVSVSFPSWRQPPVS